MHLPGVARPNKRVLRHLPRPRRFKAHSGARHLLAKMLAAGLNQTGFTLRHSQFFDTLVVRRALTLKAIVRKAQAEGINLRPFVDAVGISLNRNHPGERPCPAASVIWRPVDAPADSRLSAITAWGTWRAPASF